MSERCSESYVESGPVVSSRGSMWRERRHKSVKIGIVSKRKNGPTSEKARTRHIGQCRARQGMGNLTREMRNLSGYANW